jgi:catechol 2,3-dioxygenase-like lactoylglutathione lyase family enzyme
MARVVGIDHLVIRVSNYEKSKAFYSRLLEFLGFEVLFTKADFHHYPVSQRRLLTSRPRAERSEEIPAQSPGSIIVEDE